QNVADDRHVQTGDFSSPLADRIKIEQRLRWMFMRAIAGIDHARFQPICQKLRCAGGTVTENENVSMQRLQIPCRVFECLAFGKTRTYCRDVDYVSTQPKRSQFKRSEERRVGKECRILWSAEHV